MSKMEWKEIKTCEEEYKKIIFYVKPHRGAKTNIVD